MENDKQPKVRKQTRQPAKAQLKTEAEAQPQAQAKAAQMRFGSYKPLPNFKGCRNC